MDPGMLILSLSALVAALALFRIVALGNKHKRNIARSHRVLKKVSRIHRESAKGQVMAYLRCVDPYVFEETVLSAFHQQGLRVIRNRRYSGDGGIDGKLRIGKKTLLIQVKRYRSHIRLVDLREFAQICENKGVGGLFIHTGRTGGASWSFCQNTPIRIISGDLLIRLCCEKNGAFWARWLSEPCRLVGKKVGEGALADG